MLTSHVVGPRLPGLFTGHCKAIPDGTPAHYPLTPAEDQSRMVEFRSGGRENASLMGSDGATRKSGKGRGAFSAFSRQGKSNSTRPLLAIGLRRGIVQSNELPWRVIRCGKWVFRIRILYGHDLSAADSPENKVLIVNGDNSVSFSEYRIVVHRVIRCENLRMRYKNPGPMLTIGLTRQVHS